MMSPVTCTGNWINTCWSHKHGPVKDVKLQRYWVQLVIIRFPTGQYNTSTLQNDYGPRGREKQRGSRPQ